MAQSPLALLQLRVSLQRAERLAWRSFWRGFSGGFVAGAMAAAGILLGALGGPFLWWHVFALGALNLLTCGGLALVYHLARRPREKATRYD